MCHHPHFIYDSKKRYREKRCEQTIFSVVLTPQSSTVIRHIFIGCIMFSKLKELYQFVDSTVLKIQEQFSEHVRCTPGCADCCHAVFDISFIEAAYLASHLINHPKILESQQERAQTAAVKFEKLITEKADLATARVRCPLLGEDDLCLAHDVRPINCRTYGTPTSINGKAHVCGLSGFNNNREYPTIDLAPLQKSLSDYSIELVGEDFGKRRFPIAWVFLKTSFFLPPEK